MREIEKQIVLSWGQFQLNRQRRGNEGNWFLIANFNWTGDGTRRAHKHVKSCESFSREFFEIEGCQKKMRGISRICVNVWLNFLSAFNLAMLLTGRWNGAIEHRAALITTPHIGLDCTVSEARSAPRTVTHCQNSRVNFWIFAQLSSCPFYSNSSILPGQKHILYSVIFTSTSEYKFFRCSSDNQDQAAASKLVLRRARQRNQGLCCQWCSLLAFVSEPVQSDSTFCVQWRLTGTAGLWKKSPFRWSRTRRAVFTLAWSSSAPPRREAHCILVAESVH